jgi:hypothetical protein
MTENIAYTGQWQLYFEKLSFRRFEDYFCRFEGEQINKNTKRSVLVRTFNDTPEPHTFFMKRFFDPHYKDIFFAVRNWGCLCSQGQLEWNCANYLMSNGIKTYQPVCYGHIKRFGLERQSFFMTKKLAGQCLMDYVAQSWRSMGEDQQAQLLRELAKFCQKIHSLGVSLPDLYIYHLFIEPDPQGGHEFAVIDLHRMSINIPAWRMLSCRIENLARLNFSLRQEYFTMQQRMLVIKESLSDLSNDKIEKTITKIFQRSEQLGRRRKPPKY